MSAERETPTSKERTDRQSTWDEIRQATIMNPTGLFEMCSRLDLPCQIRNEQGGLEDVNLNELELLLHLQNLEHLPKN